MRPAFDEVLAALTRHFGRSARPRVRDPFEQIVFENVAYLVDDERRAATFAALKKKVGVAPAAIATAKPALLIEAIAHGGMKPEMRAEKLVRASELALGLGAPLRELVKRPLPEARKVLRRFPGVGAPVADRILLFAGAHPVFAVESNGLRVLTRLGFGAVHASYDKTYRQALEAVGPELPDEVASLTAAHQLLRRLGQELCRRSGPECPACPLRAICPSAR